MLYDLHTLSREDLERLYVEEISKFYGALLLGFSHNTVQTYRINVDQIDYELTKRKGKTLAMKKVA